MLVSQVNINMYPGKYFEVILPRLAMYNYLDIGEARFWLVSYGKLYKICAYSLLKIDGKKFE